MDYTYEEFKKTPEYEEFIKKNNSIGRLKVQAYTAHQGMPIPDTDITIIKNIGDKKVIFFKGKTDEDGIIDNIVLPAPGGTYNEEKLEIPEPAIYEILVSNKEYDALKKFYVGIFNNEKAIQNIKMVPAGDNNG